MNEALTSAGIVAFGFLIFTILTRVTIPVLSGQLAFDRPYDPEAPEQESPLPPAAQPPVQKASP